MNVRYFYLILGCIAILSFPGFSQQNSDNLSFLQQSPFFHPIVLDPAECLNHGGLLKIRDSDGQEEGIYIPVNIGFRQSLIRYNLKENQDFELCVEAAVFTQFTIKKVETNTYLGEMENADYRLSFLINYQYNTFTLRARTFHMSSHFADDYILRNQITSPNDGTLNYEQFDLTGSIQKKQLRYYGGLGMVITPNAVRDRFSAQLGTFYRRSGKSPQSIRYVGGIDIKTFEQNDYSPNIRSGLGIELGSPQKAHLAIMLEYYNGNLPYSTLEYKKVQWLGLSVFLLSTIMEQ
jgi:hypothetical protein